MYKYLLELMKQNKRIAKNKTWQKIFCYHITNKKYTMFLFIQDDKEQHHKHYANIEIVTIGALGDTICKAIILFWRIRTLHHFKNHLISQESILSNFMKFLFVQ